MAALELLLGRLLVEPHRELGVEAQRLLGPARRACRRRVEHEAREALRLGQGVLECEHPAPRGTEEMDPLQPEPLAQVVELLDEGLDDPQREVVRAVGDAAAELVVEDDAPPLLCERGQPLERVVRASRSAMQTDERQPPGRLAVPEDPIGRTELAEREPALHGGESTQLRDRPGVAGVQQRARGRPRPASPSRRSSCSAISSS